MFGTSLTDMGRTQIADAPGSSRNLQRATGMLPAPLEIQPAPHHLGYHSPAMPSTSNEGSNALERLMRILREVEHLAEEVSQELEDLPGHQDPGHPMPQTGQSTLNTPEFHHHQPGPSQSLPRNFAQSTLTSPSHQPRGILQQQGHGQPHPVIAPTPLVPRFDFNAPQLFQESRLGTEGLWNLPPMSNPHYPPGGSC